jgi:calcineurin-like phosphoesterase family protein
MDLALIDNWNQKITDRDTVYILGDLFWDKETALGYLPLLRGKKTLVVGNHDAEWIKAPGVLRAFQQVVPYLQINFQGHAITMCHYPLLEWKGSRGDDRKPGYLIHGHIHNRTEPMYEHLFRHPFALNAGVDINHYAPVTLEELLENNAAFKQQYWKENT